jgi:hypothetical protein
MEKRQVKYKKESKFCEYLLDKLLSDYQNHAEYEQIKEILLTKGNLRNKVILGKNAIAIEGEKTYFLPFKTT